MSKRLLLEDLARSGIDRAHLKELGFRTLTGGELAKALGRKVHSSAVAYEIPFFDHTGRKINFSRFRLLKGRWAVGKKKNFKYNQRANTAPHLYFPPTFPWADHVKDGRITLPRLVVTEGEKKAVKACLTGIPTVALAGVYNFKSKKRNISLIKEFKLFDFSSTAVEICYDSDLNTNEFVRDAMNAFSSELVTLKPKSIATVYLDGASAPEKTGLDDFLLSFKTAKLARKAFDALPREYDERSAILKELDQEIVFSIEHDSFFKISTQKFTSARALREHYGNQPKIISPDNPNSRILPIDLWFNHRHPSTQVQRVIYEPARATRFRQEPRDQYDSYNLWTPPDLKPVKGKPTLWLTLFDHITRDLTAEQRAWFMQWLAYPLQNPGTKLLTAAFVYSATQGVGKNFLVYPFFEHIYGNSFAMVGGDALVAPFNGWMAKKQFIFSDEVYLASRSERKDIIGRLNALITTEKIMLNEKYMPHMTLTNYANLYVTSNHGDAIPIDDTDRRLFVVHAPEKRLERAFYDEMDSWAKNGRKAAGQIYRYLIEDVDCASFNPRADAPRTKARAETVSFSADTSSLLIEQIFNDPDSILCINGKRPSEELYTAQDICGALNRFAQEQGYRISITPQIVAARMRSRTRKGQFRELKIRTIDGVITRGLYALYNLDDWRARTKAEWIAAYRDRVTNLPVPPTSATVLPFRRRRKA